jgi:fatty acid desaturase
MTPPDAPQEVYRKGAFAQKRYPGATAAEWPTILLSIAIYGLWAGLTFWHAVIPFYCLVPAGAWVLAWHSSLQHEIVHGHPTRWRTLNRLIGSIPLSLWLPFLSYKRSHLIHHRDERLTDPLDDPESNYCRPTDWESLSPMARRLILVQRTLLGRLVLGPIWTVGGFLKRQMQQILADGHLQNEFAFLLLLLGLPGNIALARSLIRRASGCFRRNGTHRDRRKRPYFWATFSIQQFACSAS